MSILIDEIQEKFSVGAYQGNFGCFYVNTDSGMKRHYSCREEFHTGIDSFVVNGLLNWYGYGVFLPANASNPLWNTDNRGTIEALADLIEKVEDKLKITKKTKIYRSRIETIAILYPAAFWFTDKVRHSFYTCVLRGARYHKVGDDYMASLHKTAYLNPLSTRHFLEGNTKYMNSLGLYPAAGWKSTFYYTSQPNLDNMLAKDETSY